MKDPNTSRNAGLYTNYTEPHTYHIQYQRHVTQLKFSICLGFCYWVRIDIARLVCNQNLIFCSCNNQGSAPPVHRPKRKIAEFEQLWMAASASLDSDPVKQANWVDKKLSDATFLKCSNENNAKGGYGAKLGLLRPIKWLNCVIANTRGGERKRAETIKAACPHFA